MFLAHMEPVTPPPHDWGVELARQAPAIIVALLSGLPGLLLAIRANKNAAKAARRQISFALEDAVISGAISAPADSTLRTRTTPEVTQ